MRPTRILETALYADDLDAAEAFYATVLGLETHARVPGRHVFFRCGDAMLLVFNPEATARATGAVPPHGARGPGHVAFAVDDESLASWRDQLRQHEVTIEAETTWPNGGRSLYFRDPAGNSVELATPATWSRPEFAS